jgi:hypothetical protein
VSLFFNARFWVLLGLLAALGVSHGLAYRGGRAVVRAAWDGERAERAQARAVASELARNREKSLSLTNEGIARENALQTMRRAAAQRATADQLRELQGALAERGAGADTATAARLDGAARLIAGECPAALEAVDRYGQGLADQLRGLQSYAGEVCQGRAALD